MTTDNRTNDPNQNETKSGQTFCFTEAQVEAAAKAMHETGNPWFAAYGDWGAAGFEIKKAFRESARAALVAAQDAAPQAESEHFHIWSTQPCKPGQCRMEAATVLPSSTVDEDALVAERDELRRERDELLHIIESAGRVLAGKEKNE